MVRDDLGKRMKEFYEQVPKARLMRRVPVAIRIDGKAFHTFTRHLKKPFDMVLVESMQDTMLHLCNNIQGCVLGYTQSDEITLILCDYQTLTTSAWFDYEIQKMCSVAASMATLAFNQAFDRHVDDVLNEMCLNGDSEKSEIEYVNALLKAKDIGAMFDARVFNIPREEVTNLVYWRQLDAMRNSIEMVGHANFSPSQLHKKSCEDIVAMLKDIGIEYDEQFATYLKRGSCAVKRLMETGNVNSTLMSTPNARKKWVLDKEIPVFKDENREYIEKEIRFDD